MVAMETDDRPPKRRRKEKPVEVEPQWEKTRTFAEQKPSVTGLPVVREDGKVERPSAPKPKFTAKAQKDTIRPQPADVEQQIAKPVPNDDVASNISKQKLRKMTKSARAKARQQLIEASNRNENFETIKLNIAGMASRVISNPEEHYGLLSELREMAQLSKGRAAALVILTESQLYKDIAPAYRIRNISEKEAQVKVSREVARLRQYEASLLKNYQRFVKSIVSLIRWRSGGAVETEASRNMNAVRLAACKALAELARALPHFNEAETVARTVCTLVTDREEVVRKQSADALKQVLADAHRASGQTLSTCVFIAKQLADVAAAKLNAAPAQVVDPLVSIQFGSFARLPLSDKNDRKKVKRTKLKRRRKTEKKESQQEETELERDLREADAEASPQELYNARKALLDAVCHAYFNIIKSASALVEQDEDKEKVKRRKPPPALTAALKGLLRISTYISTDIIEAILAALTPLLEAARLPLAIRFRCLTAAYAILGMHAKAQEADPDSFTGDARAMDTALYAALGSLYGAETPIKEQEYMTFDAIETILSSISYRQIPSNRCASLARRLSVLAASAPTHACSVGLLLGSQLLLPPGLVAPIYEQQEGPMTERGYGGESGLVQNFDMATDDPEIANAERSASWELSSLMAHFHPYVREIASKCAQGLCGDQLPRKTENILLEAKSYCSSQGGFNPAPKSSWTGNLKKRKRGHFVISKDAVLREYLPIEKKRVEFIQECDIELPSLENVELL